LRISEIRFKDFKRFSELTISGIPDTARLIILAGPNGSGKSSFLDGLKVWHWFNGAPSMNLDESYHAKVGGVPQPSWNNRVVVKLHDAMPVGPELLKKMLYVRSAFRNEPDFVMNGISRMPPVADTARVQRLIDNDISVSDNYQRLVLETVNDIYGGTVPDDTTKKELRERIVGAIQASMAQVFPDLQLDGVGDPLQQGSFYFTKGTAKRFAY